MAIKMVAGEGSVLFYESVLNGWKRTEHSTSNCVAELQFATQIRLSHLTKMTEPSGFVISKNWNM